MLYRKVYLSSTIGLLSQTAIDDILAVSRRNNHNAGITGLLLYHDGNVLQVLEGPEEKVHTCYERIKGDPRHRGCFLLQTEAVERRLFESWDMGYAPFEELTQDLQHGFLDLKSLPHSSKMQEVTQDQKAGVFVNTFLKGFKDLAHTKETP